MDIADLRKLLWSFASHRVVTVASRTGILSRLAEADGTAEDVAADRGLDPVATAKLMRALTALGILQAEGAIYRAAPSLSRYFRPGADDLTSYVDHTHHLYDRWGETLESWVRGEEVPIRRRSAEETAGFAAAMSALGAQVAKQVAEALDLTGVRRLLDVGGGLGHYSKALCRAAPMVYATVLDRPEVVALGEPSVLGTELEARISYRGGDYLASDFGEDFDLVLLANVLHQETPDFAAELVRRSVSALAPGGRLAIVDFAIDPEKRAHLQGALFAINMRSYGDTYTEQTIRLWMAAADLVSIRRIDLDDARWLITGTKPE